VLLLVIFRNLETLRGSKPLIPIPPAYNTGPWQGKTTTAHKKSAWPRNFKSTGRVGVCKGSGTGNREQGTGNRKLPNLAGNAHEGQIEDFRKKVEQVQLDSNTGVTELKTLIGTLGNLNQALTEEAHNLATALRRDTKAQGNWGETILRNILDKSGLQEGIHYSFQQSFTELNGEGDPIQRRQTDVIGQAPWWPPSDHRLKGLSQCLQ
jgi:hypothetical protein